MTAHSLIRLICDNVYRPPKTSYVAAAGRPRPRVAGGVLRGDAALGAPSFRARLRVLPQAAQGAVDLLRYDRDRPDLQDRETRTVLARLLSLYAVALRRGDDPVIGLGANLRR